MADSGYEGIDRAISTESMLDYKAEPLTAEILQECIDLYLKENSYKPYVEIHHPECPKYVTQVKKACRCGAAPLEGVLKTI